HALEGTERQPKINVQSYEKLSHYWENVRKFYQAFESGMQSPHTEIYFHEMPGGQYSNLQQQAKAVGLEDRWYEVQTMFRRVRDRKSTRLNSSHVSISYAVFCLKKKMKYSTDETTHKLCIHLVWIG